MKVLVIGKDTGQDVKPRVQADRYKLQIGKLLHSRMQYYDESLDNGDERRIQHVIIDAFSIALIIEHTKKPSLQDKYSVQARK